MKHGLEITARAPRIALVHDFLVSLRGADRVFLEMCEMFPDADIFVPIFDRKETGDPLAGRNVTTSFLQRLRPTARTFRALLPLYPAAIESFDLSGYDVVISSSSAWAHGVICDEGAVHICYCHNPFRYAWSERHRALDERRDPVSRALLAALLRRWRTWDWVNAQRVTHYLTNSQMTRDRIKSYLGREAEVIYPPVATDRFARAEEPGDYYMLISELVSHKRIDEAVTAFSRLDLPLIIVGSGPERRRLGAIAGPSVTFRGRVGDREAARLLANCRALVVTSTEEFGIAAVEAQAAGRPVLARASGGALETVVEGETGHLWTGGAEGLEAALRTFDAASFDPSACVANARRFDTSVFADELFGVVKRSIAQAEENAEQRTAVEAPRRATWLTAVGRGSRAQ